MDTPESYRNMSYLMKRTNDPSYSSRGNPEFAGCDLREDSPFQEDESGPRRSDSDSGSVISSTSDGTVDP